MSRCCSDRCFSWCFCWSFHFVFCHDGVGWLPSNTPPVICLNRPFCNRNLTSLRNLMSLRSLILCPSCPLRFVGWTCIFPPRSLCWCWALVLVSLYSVRLHLPIPWGWTPSTLHHVHDRNCTFYELPTWRHGILVPSLALLRGGCLRVIWSSVLVRLGLSQMVWVLLPLFWAVPCCAWLASWSQNHTGTFQLSFPTRRLPLGAPHCCMQAGRRCVGCSCRCFCLCLHRLFWSRYRGCPHQPGVWGFQWLLPLCLRWFD